LRSSREWTDLSQFLWSFEANSCSIQRKGPHKMAKFCTFVAEQSVLGQAPRQVIIFALNDAIWSEPKKDKCDMDATLVSHKVNVFRLLAQ
jgi:hypothetical protein